MDVYYKALHISDFLGLNVRVTMLDDERTVYEGILEVDAVNDEDEPEAIALLIGGQLECITLAGVEKIEEI
jgi:hypothetical protein